MKKLQMVATTVLAGLVTIGPATGALASTPTQAHPGTLAVPGHDHSSTAAQHDRTFRGSGHAPARGRSLAGTYRFLPTESGYRVVHDPRRETAPLPFELFSTEAVPDPSRSTWVIAAGRAHTIRL